MNIQVGNIVLLKTAEELLQGFPDAIAGDSLAYPNMVPAMWHTCGRYFRVRSISPSAVDSTSCIFTLQGSDASREYSYAEYMVAALYTDDAECPVGVPSATEAAIDRLGVTPNAHIPSPAPSLTALRRDAYSASYGDRTRYDASTSNHVVQIGEVKYSVTRNCVAFLQEVSRSVSRSSSTILINGSGYYAKRPLLAFLDNFIKQYSVITEEGTRDSSTTYTLDEAIAMAGQSVTSGDRMSGTAFWRAVSESREGGATFNPTPTPAGQSRGTSF